MADAEATPPVPGDEEETPLFKAVHADDASQVAAAVAAGADLAAQSQPFGWTALHFAAGHGKLAATVALLEASADANSRASDGETPLHLAAQAGEEQEIRLLVQRGADVAAVSRDGETALHVGVQHIGSKSLNHLAALLELRADPMAQDSEGRNVFEHAQTMTNRAEELQALLGGNGDQRNGGAAAATAAHPMRNAATELDAPLKAACRKGQVDIIRSLLRWTTDPMGVAARAMVAAAASGSIEAVEALVVAGADVRTAPPDEASGTTPLIAAADENATKMVRWLLVHNADPRAASRDGATALMAASMRGSTESAAAILEARADTEQQANGGWTALMLASQSGRVDVARLLLDARAQMETTNGDGSTARVLAAAGGHGEVVKLLDTRQKLTQRRAKAAQKGDPVEGPTEAAVQEDTRDLEDLLASLGEPNSKKGRKKPTAAATAAAAPAAAAKAAAPAKAAAAAPAPAPSVKAAAAVEAPAGAKAKAKSRAKRTPEEAAKVKTLQQRLAELAKKRAEIVAEEAEVSRQLAELGA